MKFNGQEIDRVSTEIAWDPAAMTKNLTETKSDGSEIAGVGSEMSCVSTEIDFVGTEITRDGTEIDFVGKEMTGAFPEMAPSF